MKKLLLFLLLATPAFGQTHHILPRSGGGTGPWISGDSLKVFLSNGTLAPAWGTLTGGGWTVDTTTSTAKLFGVASSNTAWVSSATATANDTIAPPTAGTQDGYVLKFFSTTADTVIVHCSNGFNGKGSAGTITTAGRKGDGDILTADNGVWYENPKNALVQ